MSMPDFRLIAALGVTGLVCLPAGASADEQKVKLADVPAVVRQAAAKAVPDAKWTEATTEAEDGETTFEIIGEKPGGRAVSVGVSEAGKVLEIENEIPLKEVPRLITDACKAKYPKFQPSDAETVSKDGKIVAYELSGKLGQKEVDIRVSADGKTVELDDEED
jgi:hypothetical protein